MKVTMKRNILLLLCLILLAMTLTPVNAATTSVCNWTFDNQEKFGEFKAWTSSIVNTQVNVTFDEIEKAMKAEHIADGQGRITTPNISWKKDTTYLISFRAKGEGAKLGFYSNTDQNFPRIQNGVEVKSDISLNYNLTKDWKTYSVAFKCLEDRNKQLFFYFPIQTARETCWIDDFSIVEGAEIYDAIDLSGTEKTTLAPGETS